MIVVGICGGSYGKPWVGRTTVAEALVASLGFKKLSLMDVVRDAAKSSGSPEPESYATLDAVCRSGRKISENFWLNLTVKRMSGIDKIVLDDLWFGNEASFVRDNNGIVVMISRPGVINDPDLEFEPDIRINNVFDSPERLSEFSVGVISKAFPKLRV
jgi:hypothetical protein